MAQAKANLRGSFPLRIDSNRKQADYLSLIGVYGLSPRYLAEFQARIDAVTLAQVRQSLTRHLSAENWVVVMVGNLASIDSSTDHFSGEDEKPH